MKTLLLLFCAVLSGCQIRNQNNQQAELSRWHAEQATELVKTFNCEKLNHRHWTLKGTIGFGEANIRQYPAIVEAEANARGCDLSKPPPRGQHIP